MSVKLKKIEVGKYEVLIDGELIGVAFVNYKGLYQIELPNCITVQAVNQRALKEMILKNI